MNQSKLAKAEELLKRALQGYERSLGPEQTSTLEVIAALGHLHMIQRKPDEAEELLKRSLQGYESSLGPEHPLTLEAVDVLGHLYSIQGKQAMAGEMCQRLLQGSEKSLGPEHKLSIEWATQWGSLFSHQGKLVKAVEMYQRVLQGYEKSLGPKHTSTLDAVNNLNLLYSKLRPCKEYRDLNRERIPRYMDMYKGFFYWSEMRPSIMKEHSRVCQICSLLCKSLGCFCDISEVNDENSCIVLYSFEDFSRPLQLQVTKNRKGSERGPELTLELYILRGGYSFKLWRQMFEAGID
jgi:tetratricopeptide (TPR) repeat protein